MRVFSALALLLLVLGVSACGKKGGLDTPPDAVEDERIERDWGE